MKKLNGEVTELKQKNEELEDNVEMLTKEIESLNREKSSFQDKLENS